MDTAFKKDTAGCAMGKGFICIKAILKYRHGSLPQSKLSRELAQVSRNHEVPWLYQCGAKSRVFEKAVDFRALKIIGHRWGYSPQINTDWHRLRAKGSD